MRKILSVLFLISACYTALQAQQITLSDLFVTRTFQQSKVDGLASTNDGLNYTTLENSGQQIVKYSYKTGEKVNLILDIQTLKNDSIQSIREYTFSADETKVLLLTDRKPIYRRSFTAVYFVYNFVTKELTKLSTGRQQVATFSPDGERIAFVRNNNLFVKSLRFNTERQITTDGEFNKIINGIPDWVYEEEFEFNRAFEWSPDSKQVAYIKFDEEQVPTFGIPMYKGLNPEHKENSVYPGEYRFKYPKAGEKNSIVSVWVYDIKAGQNIKMDTGTETDIYIPRIRWNYSGSNLGILKMNRLQNRLELLFANSYTGDTRQIYAEKNKRYIETDFLDNLQFLPDDKSFVILSEQDGYKHLYLYDNGGVKNRQLTTGKFDVLKYYGFEPASKMFYYQAAAVSPLQREVYGVSADLKKKILLSTQKGSNDADFSTGFKYFINEYSNATTPLLVTLHEISGKQIRVLEDNKALKSVIADRKIPQKEFFTFKTSEGTELNGWMIKPLNFNPNTKYPVLMTQYSGPNSQSVIDKFEIGWDNYLAENGYLIACIDPRGTGARGEDFRKCTYGQLGKYETDDQIEAAKYLASLTYVDGKNIAIWGWSYGGFMSAMCLAKGGEVFKAGIAVASVINQRYYDSVYSERYMGLPGQNPEGYDENSPIAYVKGIKGKLLLVHGTGDDNVHFQNSLEFAEAMVQAGVQFQMMAYVNRNHGIRGRKYNNAPLYNVRQFFKPKPKMSSLLKVLLIITGILLTIIGGLYLFIHIAFNGIFTGPSYNKEDLIENFEHRKKEIIEAKNYFESILPAKAIVHIEFDNNKKLGIFHVKVDSVYENNWNLKIGSSKTDSLLNKLGWTITELKILKSKLDNANCISISSSKPVTIGWQRSGMGMFFYDLFDQNLNDSLIAKYNDGCTYIFYKDNVVLEYGGGAIGPQCFPGYKRKE